MRRVTPVLVDSLRELSDETLQSLVWTGLLPETESSFLEAICGVFYDSAYTYYVDKGEIFINPTIDAEIKKLKTFVDRVNEKQSVEHLIACKEMKNVRDQAKKVLNRLEAL